MELCYHDIGDATGGFSGCNREGRLVCRRIVVVSGCLVSRFYFLY